MTHNQQNLSGREIALLVLGSNIWPIVRNRNNRLSGSFLMTKLSRFERDRCRTQVGRTRAQYDVSWFILCLHNHLGQAIKHRP